MKEALIRKKAIEELWEDNWVCWWPKKVRYHETDIFGVYDLICLKRFQVKNAPIKLIQLTTAPNISARRKKIRAFLEKYGVSRRSEAWGWDKKKKKFKVIQV